MDVWLKFKRLKWKLNQRICNTRGYWNYWRVTSRHFSSRRGATENLFRMITDYVYQFRGEDRDQNRGILLLGMNRRMDGKTAVPTDWLTHQWKDRQNLRNKSPQRRLESVQLFSGDGWYLIYSNDRSSFLIRNHVPTEKVMYRVIQLRCPPKIRFSIQMASHNNIGDFRALCSTKISICGSR